MFHDDEKDKSKVSTIQDYSSKNTDLPFVQKFISSLPKKMIENNNEDKFCYVKYDEENVVVDVKFSEEMEKCGIENGYRKIIFQ